MKKLFEDSDCWYLIGGLATVLMPHFHIVHYQYHYILVPIVALWIHHRQRMAEYREELRLRHKEKQEEKAMQETKQEEAVL